MTGPRPIANPEMVAWTTVVLTIAVAGLIGGGAAWLISRRWP